MTLADDLKKVLLDSGANLVGIGDLSKVKPDLRKEMPYGICIAVAIRPEVIKNITLASMRATCSHA